MADQPAQKYPDANVLTDLYTVPDDKQATMNVHVCNQAAQASTFRLAVAPNGEDDASKHYYYYNEPIDGYRGFQVVIGMRGASGTVVRCWSGNGQISFNLSRIEEAE